MNSRAAHRWQTFSAAMPGVGVSLLVAAKCPACWLAYAGLLTMPGVAWFDGGCPRPGCSGWDWRCSSALPYGMPGHIRPPLSIPVRRALRMHPRGHQQAHS